MSEKEPRKRRKRKEGIKKDDHGEDVLHLSKTKHIKEEVSDSDADTDDDVIHEPNGVARCVFFVLFSLLVAASGIIYFSLQGSEKSSWEINLPSENVPLSDEAGYENILPTENTDESLREEELVELPPEQMHPWAQHEERQTQKLNFDSLYDESEYEDEAGFLDSTSKTHSDEIPRGEFTENDAVEVSISNIEENVENIESWQSSQVVIESELPADSIAENEIPISASVLEHRVTEVLLESDHSLAIESSSDEIDNSRWAELDSESLPSASHVFLESSVASQPAESWQVDFTHALEDESHAKSTENVALPESEISHTEVTTDEATENVLNEETFTIVENTDISSSEVSGSISSPEPSAEAPYENEEITNDYDFIFREELDEADQIIQKSPEKALKAFDSLLSRHPRSPRAQYGQAKCLDKLAETRRSNALLEQAINAYSTALQQPNITEALYVVIGQKAADRMRFRGFVAKALRLQIEMSKKYPENANISNQVAVSYLMAGKGQEAKMVLKQVLEKHPRNGFAKVHYGFILKTEENKHKEAIKYLSEGIETREPGVIDGRFFFHLGDALARNNRGDEAMKVYERGVEEGVFLSVYQRSLYNVKGLTGKPWWKPQETPYFSYITLMEKNWRTIQKEALSLMNAKKSGFTPESEGLQDTGEWKQFELFARGRKVEKNCARVPLTCSLLEKIPDAVGCKRGQIKFSIMQPGTHVWAHTGPTNCRLRSHLGLVVPKGPRIRVANESREWTEGKVLMFDDSFEHEVWHDGSSFRLVLIVDFWHPELTPAQRKSLTPI